MGKQCHPADLRRRERKNMSYCWHAHPLVQVGSQAMNSLGDMHETSCLSQALYEEGAEKGLHRRGSLGLLLLFLILALASPYISPLSYRVEIREEKHDKSLPSLLYVWKWQMPFKQPRLVSESSHMCIPSLYHFKTSRREDKLNTFIPKAITMKEGINNRSWMTCPQSLSLRSDSCPVLNPGESVSSLCFSDDSLFSYTIRLSESLND